MTTEQMKRLHPSALLKLLEGQIAMAADLVESNCMVFDPEVKKDLDKDVLMVVGDFEIRARNL